MNQVVITKVVSRNFIIDFIAKFQNIVGLNLKSYERMIDEGIKQINQEIEEKKI